MNINETMDELEEILQTEEDDFNNIFQKFMTLVDSPKFRDMGKRKKNKLLETVIKKAVSDIDMPDVQGIRINFIRKYNFYHGSFLAGGMPGIVIYFGDIKMGLITIPRNLKGENSFFRFSGTEIPSGGYITDMKSTETH
ncbi:MAG: hypothetical protein GY950_12240 [bacterium]|nr:hypothetical protein [bacterium]